MIALILHSYSPIRQKSQKHQKQQSTVHIASDGPTPQQPCKNKEQAGSPCRQRKWKSSLAILLALSNNAPMTFLRKEWKLRVFRRSSLFLAAVIVSLFASTGLCFGNAEVRVEAITQPNKDVVLSFIRPGQVSKILVKDGESVKAGQVLVQLDDSVEQARLAQLKAQAEDGTRILAADAQYKQKKVDLDRVQLAAKQNVATELEVQHAQLDVLIAKLSLKLAKFEQEQNKLQYREMCLELERMRLKSPCAGKVERLFVKEGESVDSQNEDKVIRIVDISTLRIDTPVPLKIARRLRKGQSAVICFDREGKEQIRGRIVHKASVADAASDTLMVRVEIPNRTARPAGERVFVQFTKNATNINNTVQKSSPPESKFGGIKSTTDKK
ncbi:MAG: efflux RND transporter periplasmic adaptor subunit [Anaerohalosphaeraceae bacterium]|nr:efflux RND transporter periplasmic adaptor subunit [Anaerohalosphaeraceae bacterium]